MAGNAFSFNQKHTRFHTEKDEEEVTKLYAPSHQRPEGQVLVLKGDLKERGQTILKVVI